jgi:murein DD-endopeptidase MepM/ murein hydrolase activator NlpD
LATNGKVHNIDDRFVINDIELRIAPTAISVSKKDLNIGWPTMRGSGTQNLKTGYSDITVTFSCVFLGLDDINNKLRPIVAQLRYMPFCYVENDFLRKNLFPATKAVDETTLATSTGDQIPITLAVEFIQVVKSAESPTAIMVQFECKYFNYFPYTSSWQYKDQLFGQKTESVPARSQAWKDFMAPVIADTVPIESLKETMTFSFNEVKTVPVDSPEEIEFTKDFLLGLQDGRISQRDFLSSIRTDSLAGDYGDIIKRSISRMNFPKGKVPDRIGAVDLFKNLIIDAAPKAEPNSKTYIGDVSGNVFFDRQKLSSAIEELTERSKQSKSFFDDELAKDKDGWELLTNVDAIDNRGVGFGLYKRENQIEITPDNGLILVSMNISFRNNVVTLPVLSHKYSTCQFMGSRDVNIGMEIVITSEAGLQTLNYFYDILNSNQLSNRHIPHGLLTLKVNNPILKLFNLREFQTVSLNIDTMPGKPGTYQATLGLSDANIKSSDSLEGNLNREFATTDISTIYKMVDIYMKNLYEHVEGTRSYALFKDLELPGKSEAFKNRLKRFLVSTSDSVFTFPRTRGINVFVSDITKYLQDNTQYIQPFFELENSAIPGLRKIKRIVRGNLTLNKDIESENSINLDIDFDEQIKRRNTAAEAEKKLLEISADPIVDRDFRTEILEKSSPNLKIQQLQKKILSSNPVVSWNTFLSQEYNDLINSQDILLDEFSELRESLEKFELQPGVQGLACYYDFNLGRIIPQELVGKISELSIDPDIFLASPLDFDANSVVDPILAHRARDHALTSYNNAKKQLRSWEEDSWLPDRVSSRIRETITQKMSAGLENVDDTKASSSTKPTGLSKWYEMDRAYSSFPNASMQEDIQLKAKPVTNIGASPSSTEGILDGSADKTTSVKSISKVMHSLNPEDLFMPIQATMDDQVPSINMSTDPVNNASLPGQRTVGEEEPNSSTAAFGNEPVFKPLLGNLKYSGPTAHFAAIRVRKNDAQKSPVHEGIDLLGEIGDKVFCIAKGVLQRIGYLAESGWSVDVRHDNGLTSRYCHLLPPSVEDKNVLTVDDVSNNYSSKFTQIKVGSRIAGGQMIGRVGRSRNKGQDHRDPHTPTHLHLEIFQPGGGVKSADINSKIDPSIFYAISPFGGNRAKRIPVANHGAKQGPPAQNNTLAGYSAQELAIRDYNRSVELGQAMRLIRAFPAFKIYFMQDDSISRKRFGFDDLYSYNSVVDITCVRSRKIPADYLQITMTNPAGTLTNRKAAKESKRDPNAPLKKDSMNQNGIEGFAIKAGNDIQLRLGYSNDPEKLTTVFNGKVMEIEFLNSDDLIVITCQSHAIELLQDLKGVESAESTSTFFSPDDWMTHRLIERVASYPELIHFGRLEKTAVGDERDPASGFRDLLTDKYHFTPNPVDDNLFPPSRTVLENLDDSWFGFITSPSYKIYRSTIWAIMEDMTRRHPGWIVSTVPYKGRFSERMTMFFGLPSQIYISRDPTPLERNQFLALEKLVTEANKKVETPKDKATSSNADVDGLIEVSKFKPKDIETEKFEFGKELGIFKPFRAYHLLTSKNHIISNNIRTNGRNVMNTVTNTYGDAKASDATGSLQSTNDGTWTVKFDAALPDEDVREAFYSYPNCHGPSLAKNYGISLLMQHIKDSYTGSLVVIGNPDIKPYDICTIFDDYSDMMGPVEVEQVVHRFSQDTGFITEITPDLLVTTNDWVNMTAHEYMSLVFENTASFLTRGVPSWTEDVLPSAKKTIAVGGAGAIAAGGVAVAAGAAVGTVASALLVPAAILGIIAVGAFGWNKLADFSDHGQPILTHPLTYKGKPFIASLPLEKLNNIWNTSFGQWWKDKGEDGVEGLGTYIQDAYDKIYLAGGSGKITNIFSGSTMPQRFANE